MNNNLFIDNTYMQIECIENRKKIWKKKNMIKTEWNFMVFVEHMELLRTDDVESNRIELIEPS